jgi:hypothetical protein
MGVSGMDTIARKDSGGLGPAAAIGFQRFPETRREMSVIA